MINAFKLSLIILPRGIRLIILSALVLSLSGCSLMRSLQVEQKPLPSYPEERIERNNFSVSNENDVVGQFAAVRLNKGDTLPDIARHFSLGINEISSANPGVDIWVPEAGERIILPLRFILPDAPRKGIVINLAAMRLFQYKKKGKSLVVSTYPVGIGAEDRPTPMGITSVKRKVMHPVWHVPASIAERYRKKGDPLPSQVPPGPLNPLGEYALYLSKTSYLIHGTNKPASIGLNATNGCLRMYPEHVKKLYQNTPVNTPVNIINQPYLIGRNSGTVYLEVHTSLDKSETVQLEKMYAKLRSIEKRSARPLDWGKVKTVLSEARGIPVPIFEINEGSARNTEQILEVRHPGKLSGKPEVPELNMEAWYVLAADLRNETDAVRLSEIINHQGPPIPARVLAKGDRYRVIAGPFKNKSDAEEGLKRLRIDLEIAGILIEPDRKK